jgi:hypothetical protein
MLLETLLGRVSGHADIERWTVGIETVFGVGFCVSAQRKHGDTKFDDIDRVLGLFAGIGVHGRAPRWSLKMLEKQHPGSPGFLLPSLREGGGEIPDLGILMVEGR